MNWYTGGEHTQSKLQSALSRTFRTLRYRNYRLFFGGQLISLIGTWMQQVALTWLVYRLTNSALLLGITGFAAQIPVFLFSSFAGVIADRFNRHRILIITQFLAMVQAGILAALTLTGVITFWHIIPLSLLLGCINAFDMPTRQSFVLDMVESKEDLGNAIALNSSMYNGARLIGPSIAGIMIAATGEGICFLLNAVSFLAVLAALLAMKLPPRILHKTTHGVFAGFKEGYRYVSTFAPIRYILLFICLVSILGFPFTILMPIFARDILGGDAHTLGFLMGAHGVGALAGGATLAARKNIRGLTKWIGIAAALFGAGLCLFSVLRVAALAMAVLVVVGFGMITQMASCNTILQTVSDDDKRGRVMSFYTLAFMGMSPFGNLLAGTLANAIGAPATVMVSGLVCIAGAIAFFLKLPAIRRDIRPVYMRIGIIPQVAQAEGGSEAVPLTPES